MGLDLVYWVIILVIIFASVIIYSIYAPYIKSRKNEQIVSTHKPRPRLRDDNAGIEGEILSVKRKGQGNYSFKLNTGSNLSPEIIHKIYNEDEIDALSDVYNIASNDAPIYIIKHATKSKRQEKAIEDAKYYKRRKRTTDRNEDKRITRIFKIFSDFKRAERTEPEESRRKD